MNALSLLKSSEDKFWSWFIKHEDKIFNFQEAKDKVFTEISKELLKVNKDLTFEISTVLPNGKREFIISASGIKKAFPIVNSIYEKAPSLKRWTFIKFRPRRFPINDIHLYNQLIKAKDVYFALFNDKDPNKVGIMLFFKDYTEQENNMWTQVGFLMLDEALGEYDVETKLNSIVLESTQSEYFKHAKPITDLPMDFDQFFIN